ncbi:MAG: hypothetical protein JW750_07035 [Anaerolineaceae bacterium]|nr:hypothetical protein [Anaerolineaceae bacterium]
MQNLFHPKQAYQEKPWRKQLKIISKILLVGAFVALLAALHLGLAAKAAAVTQELRELDFARVDLEELIASHETELAKLQSTNQIEPKIEEMGFVRYTYDQVVYLKVPGYEKEDTVKLGMLPGEKPLTQPILKSAYRQSLWDWLKTNANALSSMGRNLQ